MTYMSLLNDILTRVTQMETAHAKHMLEGYGVPAILVSTDYEIRATNRLYEKKFGKIKLEEKPKCFSVSHGYNKPCDQCGEDCPLIEAKESRQKEKVLHIHQTPNGREYVEVEMIPIFDGAGSLEFFVELLKPVPLASGKSAEKQLVGKSNSLKKMLEKVTKVAETDATVLLLGESGTGKELISRLVHMASERSEKPMVTLECSGLSETLIESELFGHKKGAFTGAYNDRQGLVEASDGGTLFLDEIGDVSPSTQVKLLRLIETKTFRRVGETGVRTSDFRLICATHKDLKQLVAEGQFRLDLYHRINVFPIIVPTLSERQEDIPILTEHLLRQIDERWHITEKAIKLLCAHQFSGNIRELRNLLTRATILSDTNVVDVVHVQEAIEMETGDEYVMHGSKQEIELLRENERSYINKLLNKHGGDKKAAANELGVSLRTLYRKLK